MILTPSDYELARDRAVAAVGGIQQRVYCQVHAGEVGVIRYTPEGPLFCSEVPVESASGVAQWRKRLREETRKRPPPAVYEILVLIERMGEASDSPQAWCEPGQHRLILGDFDFGPHSVRLRVKPV